MITTSDSRMAQGGYGPPGGGYGPPGGYGPGPHGGGFGPPGAPGGHGPPAGYPGGLPYGGPQGIGGGPPNRELHKEATIWLIVSALTFFLCSSCFGVAGAVFCFLAMQAADQGNVADAEAKLKWGKIITICGLVLSIVVILIFIAINFATVLTFG